jgi:hypothetical protein
MAKDKKSAPTPVRSNASAVKAGADPEKSKDLVVTLKAGALSTDVGPQVLASLARADADEEKAHAILQELAQKRYDAIASMTMAAVKAAKADDTINLGAVFRDDKKATGLLFKQIRLAMGIDEIVMVGSGDKAVAKQQTSAACAKYFPSPKDNKDSPEYQRKNTFRSNFAHQLKKCIGAASGIVDEGIVAKQDKDSGTLMISGPKVQQVFGKAEVALNEKQGAGDDKLKVKPSFTALANIGAQAHGKVVEQRPQSGTSGKAVDAETVVVSQCSELLKTINKLTTLNDAQRKALDTVANAISAKLKALTPKAA